MLKVWEMQIVSLFRICNIRLLLWKIPLLKGLTTPFTIGTPIPVKTVAGVPLHNWTYCA